ncbi:MAG: helix-turn-helix transcriptional regulator [Burkholderiaceae bacterium]|nr:helix-turn-helix transcriptional regulator [Burkholderiaceae bacterium]
MRKTNNLTVAALSELAGVARSTISKVENGQMSPTFDVIQKLCNGLNENIVAFFSDDGSEPPTGRRSITRIGAGRKYSNKCYDHEVLCTDLSNKKMFAALSTIKARSVQDFDEWVSHDGEEFFYVVSGEVIVHSELYEPLSLKAGDSMYFDCTMGHATVSASDEDAKVLWVFSPLP